MEKLGLLIKGILPTFYTVAAVIILYYAVRWILDRQTKGKTDRTLIRSIVLFSILLIGAIAIILALPMGDSLRGQITSLIGIVISAVLALSSATFIGNGFAGIMIRTVNNFRPGDFIKVQGHFGRITERGLFHSEIQNEESDLITLPNLFLVTNPVKVTRSSGTFICGTCSLGYDVNHQLIKEVLKKAAELAGLTDGFVRIIELGDFSVTYSVYGKTLNIKTLLSAESILKEKMLDCLHEAGIEIVSPNFMNQRQVADQLFIPKKLKPHSDEDQSESPEDVIFDKADEAESIEKRKERLVDIDKKIKAFTDELNVSTDEAKINELKASITRWKTIKEKLLEKIDSQIDELNSKK